MNRVQQNASDDAELFVPLHLQGDASIVSAVVRIATPSQALSDAVPAVVDAFSAAVAEDASEGDDTLRLDSAAGIVRGRFYVVNAGGRLLTVRADGVSGNVVLLGSPLLIDVSAGATIVGTRVWRQMTTSQTSIVGMGNAEFEITLDDASVVRVSAPFRVCRDKIAYTLNSDRLAQLAPESLQYQPGTDGTFAETIDTAWHMEMEPAILSRGLEPSRLRIWPGFEPAHVHAVMLVLMRASGGRDGDVEMEMRKQLFDDHIEMALTSRNSFYDEEDGTETPSDEPVITYGSIVVSR